MEAKQIIEQIEDLPIEERMHIVEQILKTIRQKEVKNKMKNAVEELKEEYKTNKDLTAFNDIDFENFYESR